MITTAAKLAANGPTVSPLVAGVMRLNEWGMDSAARVDWVEQLLDLGVTTFDLADIYGGYTVEALFGEALAARPSLRNRLQLITKCGIKLVTPNRPQHRVKSYDTSRSHILQSVDNSLRALHSDHIDLLLIHRPDLLLDADEVAATFVDLKASGKVLHFGVSNFKPWQFELLQSRLDFELVTNQVEISLLQMESLHDGTVDQCQRLRRRPMAWSPYGGGDIFIGSTSTANRVRTVLELLAHQYTASIDQIALAWLLRHPAAIIPVIGSGKIERIRSAVGALDVELSSEQWYQLWQTAQGHEVA